MSANSNLSVSPDVTAAYADAVNSDTRFILISIRGGKRSWIKRTRIYLRFSNHRNGIMCIIETLELDQTIPPSSSTLEEDLPLLPDLLVRLVVFSDLSTVRNNENVLWLK